MKKILLITLSAIVVIIVGLTVFIKIYVTPDRVKEFVVPAAERSLNRKVDIGEINISLLRGIGIKDFYIKEADGETDFVKCKEFVLKYQLLPLLSKKILVDEIKLVSPSVSIERARDGTYNFEGIGQGKETGGPEGDREKDDTEGLPISLLVRRISVDGARFSMTDHKGELPDLKSSADIDVSIESAGSGALLSKGTIDLKIEEALINRKSKKLIKDISAALRYVMKLDIDSDSIIIDSADFSIQGIPVSIAGKIEAVRTSPELDIKATLPESDVAKILETAALFTDVKGLKMSGDISADAKIKGSLEKNGTLAAETSMKLKKAEVSYDKFKSVMNADVKAVLTQDSVELRHAGLNVGGVTASIKGEITKIRTSPYADISVAVHDTAAADIMKAVSPFIDLKDMRLSGSVSADLRLRGAPETLADLKTDGDISLKTLGIRYKETEALIDGKLKLKGKNADIDLKGTSGRNTADVKGTIKNYLKDQEINLDVYAKELFIDELQPVLPVSKAGDAGEKGAAARTTVHEAEPLNLTQSARGDVKVDAAYYKGLVVNNFLMKYDFKNNKLTLTETGTTGKGGFKINTLMDLSKPGYSYSMSGNADSIHIDEFVNAFFPKAKDTVFGLLTSQFRLNGAGTLPENMKRNLVADGDFRLKDGKISNAEITRQLSLFLNVRELETIRFSTAAGTVSVRNGTARLDSSFVSDHFAMDPKGDIGLDETLDLAFDLKLSPRLTDKAMSSKISTYIKSEEGWGMIPLKVYGTLSNPSYTVDIEKAGKRVIKKETDKLIDKFFDKQDEEKKKELEPVRDLLKGIFQ